MGTHSASRLPDAVGITTQALNDIPRVIPINIVYNDPGPPGHPNPNPTENIPTDTVPG